MVAKDYLRRLGVVFLPLVYDRGANVGYIRQRRQFCDLVVSPQQVCPGSGGLIRNNNGNRDL